MFCPYCGSTLKEEARHCPYCGRSLYKESQGAATSTGGASLGSSNVGQDTSVSSVVCELLDECGPAAFNNPRRLVSLAMDSMPDSDSVAMVFAANCDEEYISIFREALQEGTAEAIETATIRAERLLVEDRSIIERVSRSVAYQTSKGVALYLGIDLPEPPIEEDTPKRVGFAYAELPNDGVANRPLSLQTVGADQPQASVAPEVSVVQEKALYCAHCGAKNLDGEMYCTTCGAPLAGRPPAEVQVQTNDTGNSQSGVTVFLVILLVALTLAIVMVSYYIITTDV